MRIISGIARGLKLQSLEGSDTRPTLDNVKEAIFSMLFDDVRDSCVLDLFAGSGALGIEALSRGAQHSVFVDSNPRACAVVRANLEKSKLRDKADVLCAESKAYISRAGKEGKKFDIVFLDPPYALGLMDEVLSLIRENNILSDNALVVCEFESGTQINITGYDIIKQKRYGRAGVMVLSPKTSV